MVMYTCAVKYMYSMRCIAVHNIKELYRAAMHTMIHTA
jgi:hypothetical protein